MHKLLFRRAVAAALAVLVSASSLAHADGAGVPDKVKSLMKSLQVDEASHLAYRDEAGKAIDAEEFVKLVAAGATFTMSKQMHEGAAPDVTFKLMSKEALAQLNKPSTKIKPGDPFPPFRLTRLDGVQVDNKALEGKYTLINFYFAQCAPCVKEIPELNAIAQKHKSINFLAMTFDSIADSKRFVAERAFSWPVVADALPFTQVVGVKGYPTFALLDPQGRVVAMSSGMTITNDKPVIEEWLEQHIAAPN